MGEPKKDTADALAQKKAACPGDETATDLNVGGQAVIEGVMMRSPSSIATAVRLPDGTIEVKKRPFTAFVKRHKYLDIPIVRGALSFFEMLVIGIETLNWSADVQLKFEDKQNGRDTKKSSFWNSVMLAGSLLFAMVVAMGIFFALPIFIASLLGLTKGAFLFNLVAGSIRLTLFLAYIYFISKMPDIKRVFRYHGAEHMSISTLESALELTVESAKCQSRFHPRCGTSFVLIVALFSVFMFGIADSLFPLVFGHMQNFPERFATHILLLPFVAGLSYELLKLSGKFRSKGFVKMMIKPGLWLQGMTTAEPDEEMIEVALCALKAAIETEEVTA